jgi:hypothetical protein
MRMPAAERTGAGPGYGGTINRRCVLAATAALLLGPASGAFASGAEIVVHKDRNCDCCQHWIAHLRSAGFEVRAVDDPQLAKFKQSVGVPPDLASCHTAQAGGYVIEGHVPADAIRRLLAERPEATGLSVPGMPIGSPGMEVPGMDPETFEVLLFDGSSSKVFARYRGTVEQS